MSPVCHQCVPCRVQSAATGAPSVKVMQHRGKCMLGRNSHISQKRPREQEPEWKMADSRGDFQHAIAQGALPTGKGLNGRQYLVSSTSLSVTLFLWLCDRFSRCSPGTPKLFVRPLPGFLSVRTPGDLRRLSFSLYSLVTGLVSSSLCFCQETRPHVPS